MMYEKLLGTEKYLRYGWKRKHWQTWIPHYCMSKLLTADIVS